MPKTKPILQLLKSNSNGNPWRIAPTKDGYILNIYFFQQRGIFVFISQCLVLFLHPRLHLLLCVFVHRLPLMKTSLFLVNHWFTWIPTTIDDSHYVPIGLSIVGHEVLEVWIKTPFFTIILFNLHHMTHWTSICLHIACHKWQLPSLYIKLYHTHGRQGSSILRHNSHD